MKFVVEAQNSKNYYDVLLVHSEKSRDNIRNNNVKIGTKKFLFKVKDEQECQIISHEDVANCCRESLEPKLNKISKT
jgi:hypothetical protein